MDVKLEKISYDGDTEALDQYLQNNVRVLDILAITPFLPNNPLHIAASRGNVEFAKAIIRHKPEFATKFNEDGNTALHLAAANGSVEVVQELVSAIGSNLCLVQDKDGMLPIHHAALKGKIEVLQVLLNACEESARRPTCLMDTILHLAVKSNCLQVLKFLIERMNVDAEFLNAKNICGNTILHLAVAWKQLQAVKWLVNKEGVDVNAVNFKSLTPLDVLKESPLQTGDEEIEAVLLEADGTMTFSYSNLPPARETTAFQAHEMAYKAEKNCTRSEHHSTRNKISPMIRKLLEYIILGAEFRAAPPHLTGKQDNTRNVNLVVNSILTATVTYLAIIYIPPFCSEPSEVKFRMIFAAILSSVIVLIFCVIKPTIAAIKTTALSMFFGSLIAILQILPENNRAMLVIFITAHFQLALCLQQLKKIEKSGRQACFSGTNTRELRIARTAKLVTVVFISFAAANYYCLRAHRTLTFAKVMPLHKEFPS